MSGLFAWSFEGFGYTMAVVLGISFLIFFHELGHFLAAKAAGVRVEAFSIGMGPRLIGWRRGDTDYKVCLLPIGGYVRMYGEMPGEGDPNDDAGLQNKSVGWRFLIYSGGVIMNLIFALIAFPLAFNAGVPFDAPLLGHVVPGSAAWSAGLERGDRIASINGKKAYSFSVVGYESALSGEQGVTVHVQRGEKEFDARLHPRFDARRGLKSTGIAPTWDYDGTIHLTDPKGPAAKAGLRDGDVLVVDWVGAGDYTLDEAGREALMLAKTRDPERFRGPRTVIVERGGKRLPPIQIEPTLEKTKRPVLGIIAAPTLVLGTRTLGDADLERALAAFGLQAGDSVLSIVTGSNARPVFDRTTLETALSQATAESKLEVLRAGANATSDRDARIVRLDIPEDFRGANVAHFFTTVALGADGISGRVVVQPGRAAAKAGLSSGDELVQIGSLEIHSWTDVVKAVAAANGNAVKLRWRPAKARDDTTKSATATPFAPSVPNYGFTTTLRRRLETYRVHGLTGSLRAGLVCSMDTLRNLYLTLKRMLGGTVSAENLGGIITISTVSYDTVKAGWQKFLYFLAILSLNLAFINVLPIPVLDGGQLLFLVIEKIKGSPVSVRVMTYAQILGIVMVLGLLIFVTFNDIMRLLR